MHVIHEGPQPAVPDELIKLMLEPSHQALHERWQALSLEEVLARRLEAQMVGGHRVTVLGPESDINEDVSIVLGMPHLQDVAVPYQHICVEYTRQLIAPGSRMYVFSNNSPGNQHYDFSESDRARMRAGSLRPEAEHQARTLDALGVQGTVIISGYSKAGMVALHLAAVRPDNFEISVVNADEAPSKTRTPFQLQQAFGRSGNAIDERRAVVDAQLPAYSEANPFGQMAVGVAKFARASLFNKEVKATVAGLAGGDFNQLITEARGHNAETFIKLGHVSGSLLFTSDSMEEAICRPDVEGWAKLHIQEYTGAGAHRHATGVNPVAHALMLKHAIVMASSAR